MTRVRTRTLAALLVTALAAAGCGDGSGQERAGDEDVVGQAAAGREAAGREAAGPAASGPDHAAQDSTGSAAARVALPGLFAIMLDLQGDMERVSRGLWTESFDTIAAGAQAVADHPRVPPEELSRVADALGQELARFKALDTRVHDLSVELAEAARAGDLETVLARDAALRQGCVECHTAFRERLRSAID